MQAPTTTVERLTETVAYQPGSIVSRMLLKKPGGNVTLFAFSAGEGLSEHTTPHDALVYVLDGKTDIAVAGDAYRLTTGEAITLPANVPHAVRAVEDFKMMLVLIKS